MVSLLRAMDWVCPLRAPFSPPAAEILEILEISFLLPRGLGNLGNLFYGIASSCDGLGLSAARSFLPACGGNLGNPGNHDN